MRPAPTAASMLTHPLLIGRRPVGAGHPCFVIAEVGINHNGKLDEAMRLVDAAIDAGADAVKFQKRVLADVYRAEILEDPRQAEQGLQYLIPILQECELSDDAFRSLDRYCRDRGIPFLCTPWDTSSVDFLESLDLPAYKVGSPDLTNLPLLDRLIATGKPLIVSTGMSTEQEIQRTIAHLVGQHARGILLHCVSAYPPAIDEYNLRFMGVLARWSGWPVGLSAHDLGLPSSLAAVALGACVLERHLTLDREQRGPDHRASLLPHEFAEQLRAIREVESALGVPHRWMTQGELMNRRALGKSLVAACNIPRGTVITRAMMVARSPGLGVSPQRINDLLGRPASRDIVSDSPFVASDLDEAGGRWHADRVDVGCAWGIVVRCNDVARILPTFASRGPSLLEFHLSDHDLDAGLAGFAENRLPYDLVVHAPEYHRDQLIDLCAEDAAQRTMSIRRLQAAVDLARELHTRFDAPRARQPKVVIHAGGMSRTATAYDGAAAERRLVASLRELRTDGIDLLLENLPPFPWYFGGRWLGHVLVDPTQTARVCRETGLGLCFDTSHAALACHHRGTSLAEFAAEILPHVRHLHVSDAAGISGEGLQIGEGEVNFVELLPVLWETGAGMVPEIWLGHHDAGHGFRVALERLTELTWAIRATRRERLLAGGASLPLMIVPATASIRDALERIDSNQTGLVFVVDDDQSVTGVVADGDVRRALLRGRTLDSPIGDCMVRDFVFSRRDESRQLARARLTASIRVVPILDAASRLVDYVSIFADD